WVPVRGPFREPERPFRRLQVRAAGRVRVGGGVGSALTPARSSSMSDIVVGMADLRVSNSPDERLVTYALGSCLGIAVYDPTARVGGLLHVMLPLSSTDMARAAENPALFVDTGVPELFRSCYRLGASKQRMIVRVAGGASAT